ncbi:MSHA biogenesis protein MshN [Candidatus Puniceispirillum marinum IMCC1322]|uniref:MSHA biogenesis protein MshN n=1 Tax=Puniceispirillum marinum (strain IMCC1322) TaxID=488538 RepID=D5BMS6_PUNMI|nr:MSHA biogenesis protein MshN [Candidatus Puniceispirillum marinum IMCC1322]
MRAIISSLFISACYYLAIGMMALTSYAACAAPDSQSLEEHKNTHSHAITHVPALSDEDILSYAAMIRRVSDKGADDAALSLAKRGTELVPESVLLRIILAKLYIDARQCRRAVPHLTYAHDIMNRQSERFANSRHRQVIDRLRKLCASTIQNVAFMSMKGQRSSSLLDRLGGDIVPIDKGSLFDRYCQALGSLCAHHGHADLKQGDRGGTSIWLHVGTMSRIRSYDVWTPTLRTHIFHKLNSKPHYGLRGAKIQLDMKRRVGDKKRFDASLSAQSAIAQQGAERPKQAHEAWRMGLTLRHFMTQKTNIGTGIAHMRIQQNMRHSKRFETRLEIATKVTNYLQAEASVIWTRTLRKSGALSSLGRDVHCGVSLDLTPWIFTGSSIRQTKTEFARPLAYLREAHQVSRREFATNIGVHLTKDKTSLIDLHFVRTKSVSHYSPDHFTNDAVIIYFQHIF